MNLSLLRKVVHWPFFAMTILLTISGLGKQYKIIRKVTLGLLSGPFSLTVHLNIWTLSLALLVAHVFFRTITGFLSRRKLGNDHLRHFDQFW